MFCWPLDYALNIFLTPRDINPRKNMCSLSSDSGGVSLG